MTNRNTFLMLSLKGGNLIQMDTSLDSWEGIADSYLKATDLEGGNGEFIITEVEIFKDDLSTKIKLSVIVNDKPFKFLLNITNTKFVKSKVDSPNDLKGKTLKWEKIRVRNPQTQQMVDGISVIDVV